MPLRPSVSFRRSPWRRVAESPAAATGLPASWALILVSHLFLVAAFVLLAAYAQGRTREASEEWPTCAVLAFGLFPPTFFFRMVYTESLFLFLCLLTLWATHLLLALSGAFMAVYAALFAAGYRFI